MGKFDFGFGFGFGGRSEQFLYKARCIIPANRFFFEGGWGRFDFGFGFGFGGHCEQYLHKSWCIIPPNCFFCRWGVGEVRLRVRLRVRWALRAICVQRPEGVGEVRLRVRLRVRWSLRAISAQILVHHPIKLFFCRGGVGEVRLRVRLRVRWALRAIFVERPVHHRSNLFFWEGGLGKFDFGFGFGFGGRSEQCLYKARCIIPANRFFLRGGGGGSTSGSDGARYDDQILSISICTLNEPKSAEAARLLRRGLGIAIDSVSTLHTFVFKASIQISRQNPHGHRVTWHKRKKWRDVLLCALCTPWDEARYMMHKLPKCMRFLCCP